MHVQVFAGLKETHHLFLEFLCFLVPARPQVRSLWLIVTPDLHAFFQVWHQSTHLGLCSRLFENNELFASLRYVATIGDRRIPCQGIFLFFRSSEELGRV